MTSVYFGINDSLMVVRHNNGAWQVERQMVGKTVQCVVADPQRPEVLYCGTFGQGVWRSDNAGASWQPVGEGMTSAEVMAVAVSPVERVGSEGVVYVGTEPSALFRSEDGGATWQECTTLQSLPSKATWSYPPRPYTHHVRCIGLDPHTPGLLIVCLENGALVRSLDSGLSFIDRTEDGPKDTHTLALHPLAPGRVYSAAGDGFVRPGNGYAESHDGGASWQRPDDGIAWHYGWGLAVDSADPDTQVISTAASPDRAHNPTQAESTLYRRSGGGEWLEVQTGLPERQGMLASELAAHPNTPHQFFAVNNRGLYHSDDAGQTWQRVDIPWPDHFRWQHVHGLAVTP